MGSFEGRIGGYVRRGGNLLRRGEEETSGMRFSLFD